MYIPFLHSLKLNILKTSVFIITLNLSFFIFQTQAQGNSPIHLQATARFLDEEGNNYRAETPTLVLHRNTVSNIIIYKTENQEIIAGNSAIFKHRIENLGNETASVSLKTTLLNSTSMEGIKSYSLYVSATESNHFSESTSTLLQRDDNESTSFSLEALETKVVFLKVNTDSALLNRATRIFRISGSTSNPESPGTKMFLKIDSSEENSLEDTLTILRKPSESIDLIYAGHDNPPSQKYQNFFNRPGQNANPYNPGDSIPEDRILVFSKPAHMPSLSGGSIFINPIVFYLRLENDTEEAGSYELGAGLYSSGNSLPENWKITIKKVGENIALTSANGKTTQNRVEIPGRVGTHSNQPQNSALLKVTIESPPDRWEYQNYLNNQPYFSIDSNKDRIYEQPILFKATNTLNGQTDQILLSFQPSQEDIHFDVTTDTAKHENVLANNKIDKEIIYTLTSRGNIDIPIDLQKVSPTGKTSKDKFFKLNPNGEEEVDLEETYKIFLTGRAPYLLKRRIIFAQPEDYLGGSYTPITVLLGLDFRAIGKHVSISQKSDHNFLIVRPEIKIEKTIDKYTSCKVEPSNSIQPQGIKTILSSEENVKAGNCLYITLKIQDQTEHEYNPKNIIVEFPLHEGLQYIGGGLNIHQKGVGEVRTSHLPGGEDPDTFTFNIGDINEESNTNFGFREGQTNNPIEIGFFMEVTGNPLSRESASDRSE